MLAQGPHDYVRLGSPTVLYHGTSAVRAVSIEREGLLPGGTGRAYVCDAERDAKLYGVWMTASDDRDGISTMEEKTNLARQAEAMAAPVAAVLAFEVPAGTILSVERSLPPRLPWDGGDVPGPVESGGTAFYLDRAVPRSWLRWVDLYELPQLADPAMRERTSRMLDELFAIGAEMVRTVG
jgi:hypothetical protein